MSSHDDIFIHDFSIATGDILSTVDQSAAANRLISDAGLLKEAGFSNHYMSSPSLTSFDLARNATEPLREKIDRVDALVFSTCLPMNANIGSAQEFSQTRDVKSLMDFPASRLQSALNLNDAFVVGLSQQACTGLLYAIRHSRALLFAERDLQQALVVTADRFPENALYEQAYNLISDGSAACLVSRNPRGFKYIAGHAITNGALAQASDDETVGTYFGYMNRCIQEILTRAQLTMADIEWIIPQNMNLKAWQIFARILQVEESKIGCPTLREVGHMISGDNLYNLQRLDEEKKISKGAKVLLPMAGFGLNWHCLILEKV